jgi:hypothetical protein
MTHLPRSHYELGDPLAEALARQERREHLTARAKGQRVLLIADACLTALIAQGSSFAGAAEARRVLFHVLADLLYQPDTAIDVPDFTRAESLDQFRHARSDHAHR